MSDKVIAKKYAKALLSEFSAAEISDVSVRMDLIREAFDIEKFRHIINSPTISSKDKANLILSLIDSSPLVFENFIKLLAENKRLALIPEISNILHSELSKIKNEYTGYIYSKNDIASSQLAQLQESFSNRFGAKITLIPIKNDYNGIRIDLNDLGVEISFSIDRLKAKMSEYIIKAM